MAIARIAITVAGTAAVLLLLVGVSPPRSRGGAADGRAVLLRRPSTWEQLSSLQAAERRQRRAAGFSRHNEVGICCRALERITAGNGIANRIKSALTQLSYILRASQHDPSEGYQLEQALSDFQSRVNLSRAQMVRGCTWFCTDPSPRVRCLALPLRGFRRGFLSHPLHDRIRSSKMSEGAQRKWHCIPGNPMACDTSRKAVGGWGQPVGRC